jgi:hypothetical protein
MVEGPFRIPARIYREDHQLREDEHWLEQTFIAKTADAGVRLAHKDVPPRRYTPMERRY